jgi:hypothetical protein
MILLVQHTSIVVPPTAFAYMCSVFLWCVTVERFDGVFVPAKAKRTFRTTRYLLKRSENIVCHLPQIPHLIIFQQGSEMQGNWAFDFFQQARPAGQ